MRDMMQYWKSLSVIVTLTILMSGCSSLQKYSDAQKPKATIAGVSIADISLKTITLNTRVRIDNPNAFELKTAGLSLDLSVDENFLANIKQPNSKLSLPAKGNTEVTLPITLAYADIYKAAGNVDNKSELPYNIKGSINLSLPVIGNTSVPVEYSDILPIPKLPDVRLNNIKLIKASFSSVQLQVDMLVKNPNNFSVDLKKLGFDVSANNKSLSSANVESVALDKNGSQVVSVPLTLSIQQLGASLFSLLTSNDAVNFKINGNANVLPDLGVWKPDPMSFSSEKRVSL